MFELILLVENWPISRGIIHFSEKMNYSIGIIRKLHRKYDLTVRDLKLVGVYVGFIKNPDPCITENPNLNAFIPPTVRSIISVREHYDFQIIGMNKLNPKTILHRIQLKYDE